MKQEVIRLRCTQEFKKKVEELARRNEKTVSSYITKLLEHEVSKMT